MASERATRRPDLDRARQTRSAPAATPGDPQLDAGCARATSARRAEPIDEPTSERAERRSPLAEDEREELLVIAGVGTVALEAASTADAPACGGAGSAMADGLVVIGADVSRRALTGRLTGRLPGG